MTINRTHLAPCPFCGCCDTSYVVVNPSLDQRHRRYKVYCKGCQIRTSDQKTKRAAREQWNRRVQAAPEAEPVATVCGSGVQWIQPQAGRLANLSPLYADPPAPQHDAELVELLREVVAELEDWRMSFPDANSLCTDNLLLRIDAKLATLRHV